MFVPYERARVAWSSSLVLWVTSVLRLTWKRAAVRSSPGIAFTAVTLPVSRFPLFPLCGCKFRPSSPLNGHQEAGCPPAADSERPDRPRWAAGSVRISCELGKEAGGRASPSAGTSRVTFCCGKSGGGNRSDVSSELPLASSWLTRQ